MAVKSKSAKTETLKIRVGNVTLQVKPRPVEAVAAADARIQSRLTPVLREFKRVRKAAAITASKIILNA